MKKIENLITPRSKAIIRVCRWISMGVFAITGIALIPLFAGEINTSAYAVWLTIIVIVEFISAFLLSILLDRSTDKQEEFKKELEKEMEKNRTQH